MTEISGGGTGSVALGRQLTIEFYDCDPRILADAPRMEQIFLDAARRSHATIIQSCFHAFTPQGVSGVVIISESHFAVHAWPEHDYAAVDIFTCGDSIDFDIAMDSLRKDLKSGQMVVSSMMNRGIVNNLGIERLAPVWDERKNNYSNTWKSRYERIKPHAFSIALDLYDCRNVSAETLKEAVLQTAGLMNVSVSGKFNFRQDDLGNIHFWQDLADGWFGGMFSAENSAVYVDFGATEYFEPRTVSEAALQILGGHHYRLQVAFRH